MRFSILVAGCIALALAATGSSVRASATVDSDFPVAASGDFQYPYSISIGFGDKISSGSFFRVYDFNNLVAGSVQAPTGWTPTTSLSNPTPPPNIILSYADDPSSPNLTFTYTGADIVGPATVTGFSALGLTSTYELSDGPARVTNSSIGGNTDSDSTVIVPAVPEPASVALLALAGGALLGRRRAR